MLLNTAFSQLSIVIPAFNEEHGIACTLKELTSMASEAEIIVVDDGSSDRTAEVALRHDVSLEIRNSSKSESAAGRQDHGQRLAGFEGSVRRL